IEEAGLKGYRVGGAVVSGDHANFILNEGEATAKDILELILLIKDRVYKNSGLLLEEEIQIIGEE
ncbi:MAG: UDP-N-acetylenolpyruvoylglucosamine reductase, partial [Nitrospinae bacterium]|nr:UDP-N-acetylenolpyruvoylglucosamine reductase [Nitrospinota bacterium]